MACVIKELDGGDATAETRWDAFVLACPEATFFHRAGWRRVAEEVFGLKAPYLYAEDAQGAIRGVLPLVHIDSLLFGNRLVSNAFCTGGGPAAVDDATAAALDEHAVGLVRKLGVDWLEYRQPPRRHPGRPCHEGLHATFAQDIEPDPDRAMKRIPGKQRNILRKGLAAGLAEVEEHGVDDFYAMFAVTMRRLGTPVYPKAYFAKLRQVFGADCEVLTATREGRPIATAMNFTFRDRVLPYYVASMPEARACAAADFLYWRIMRRMVERRGGGIFDWGRSKIGSGTYAFKRHWGFEPRPVVHEFHLRDARPLPNVSPTNPRYRYFIATWRKLPLPVANRLGPLLARGLG